MEILLSSDKISACIAGLAEAVVSQVGTTNEIAVVGIRSRGEILAERLTKLLAVKLKKEINCGVLDITLYRDDINNPHGSCQPFVRSTEIEFDINDKIIILADDVLHTGRSTRAAMDALIDLGRPKAIRLAVLVERTGREFPIQSDFAGIKIDIPAEKSVYVNFIESDGQDRVIIK